MADKSIVSPEEGYCRILEGFRQENRFRVIPPAYDPRSVFDLGANDYLGLANRHDELRKEFMKSFPDASFSSSASRLLSSNQEYHDALENLLSELYGRPALLFNSGYHANTGAISALNIPSTLFLCDKLVHASIIDGLAIGNADFRRWKHNDLRLLEKALEMHAASYERVIIVVESVYSMDGDISPLPKLVELKKRYPNVMLYIDEAHAFGVFGKRGLGLAEELSLIKDIDILVGTLGKAAASSGAFVAVSPVIRDFLVNCARSFIFSTALPPVNCAWSLFIISRITEMKEERMHLRKISRRFRDRISAITGMPNVSDSQIIPFVIGNNRDTLEMSAKLRDQGIIAPAIRRPTVPPGGERIRFSLNAGLTGEDIDRIADIIAESFKKI